MKSSVIIDELHETQLKPAPLLERYLALTKKDVNRFFKGHLNAIHCPACQSKAVVAAFKRFGLSYKECTQCHSVFVSPRPDDKRVREYYLSSSARTYWRDTLSSKTIATRKAKMVKPRLEWICESTQEYLPGAVHFADINTSHYGYCEALGSVESFQRVALVDPFLQKEKIKQNSHLSVVSSPWWSASLKQELDAVSLFEVCDRTANVDTLFASIKAMLKKDGLLFVTAIVISGFDLQVLWDKADNIFPPDRLNVFSIEGIKALVKRHGFECLELSTPGVLDVAKVEHALKANPQIELPRCVRSMVENRDDNVKKALQEFLQASLLSSYCRIVLRKK